MRLTNPVLLLGVCLLLLAAGIGWRTSAFLARATIADGAIVDNEPHPHIRFMTAAAGDVTFVQNGFVHGKKGAVIKVAYEAADPLKTAVAATFWPLWWPTVWTAVPGLALLLLGLAGASFKTNNIR